MICFIDLGGQVSYKGLAKGAPRGGVSNLVPGLWEPKVELRSRCAAEKRSRLLSKVMVGANNAF